MEIGDIVVKVGMDGRPFAKGAKETQANIRSIGDSTLQMSGRMRGALTQASFAVDDFFGVWQNSGNVGAAIRATSNNIGTLVTMMNPMAGIATTIALAFGSSLIPKLFQTGEAAKVASKELDIFRKRQESIDFSRGFRDQQIDDRNAVNAMQDSGSLQDKIAENSLKQLRLREQLNQRSLALASLEQNAAERLGITEQERVNRVNEERKKVVELKNELILLKSEARASYSQMTDLLAIEQRRRESDARGGLQGISEQLTAAESAADDTLAGRLSAINAEAYRRAYEITKQGTISGDTADRDMLLDRNENLRQSQREKEIAKDKEREARELEKAAREREQAARIQKQFAGMEMDLQSSLLTGAKKRKFDINRRFDEQRDRIFETAPSIADAIGLSQLNEAARNKELNAPGQAAGGPRFPGQFQAGSSEAFSEILRASGVADDQAKKAAKSTADNTKATATYTKSIADALRVADSLLLVPSLGSI